MPDHPQPELLVHFSSIPDPRRRPGRVLHPFVNLLFIALCALLSHADSWVDVAEFGEAKKSFFARFLDLKHGIPSHDTFSAVFRRLDPDAFARCFAAWADSLTSTKLGEVIAIDGKTARGSKDPALGRSPLHLVNAWASDRELVLGQVACHRKSNEITAIPALLELLDVTDSIVTIDAMGTQKAIAQQIIDQGGDYILALKGNHAILHAEVIDRLNWAQTVDDAHDVHLTTTVKPSHGRQEVREVVCTSRLEHLTGHEDWAGLTSIVQVGATRTVGDKTSQEWRYYLSSLPGDDAEFLGGGIREHWGIENKVHWVLDVAFREDESRVRRHHGAANLAMIRKFALNLLKQENSKKRSIKTKRHRAGWDETYLLKLLAF